MILPILCCGAPKFHLHSQVNLHRSAEIFPKSSGCIIAFYIEIFTFVNRRVGRVLSSPPNYSGQWQYHSRVDFIVTFLSLRFWQCPGAMLGNWYRNDLFDTDLSLWHWHLKDLLYIWFCLYLTVCAIFESVRQWIDNLLRSKVEWRNVPPFDSLSKRNPHGDRCESAADGGRGSSFHIPEMFLSLFSCPSVPP